jgi:signal transduction histidine kinase
MQRGRPRLGLRGKLVLTYVALSVAAMGLTGAYVIASMDGFYHRRLVTDLQDEAALLAERTAPLLSAGRLAELQDYLARMNEPLTARVIVVDRSGVQVGSTEREDAARTGQPNGEPGVGEALAGREAAGTYYSARAGAEIAYRAVPVHASDGSIVGAVRLSYRLSDVTAEIRQLYLTLAAGILAVGGVAVILGAALAARVTQPVLALAQGAHAIAAGDLSKRVPEDAPDELGELARVFNEMAERLEHHERARRELLAAQAHDLHALAGAMQAAADALSASWPAPGAEGEPGLARVLAGLRSHSRRLAVLAEDLLQVGRLETGRLELVRMPLCAGALLRRLVDEYAAEAARLGVELRLEGSALDDEVFVDAERMLQALSNLLENALRVSAGGRVALTVERSTGGLVCIAIHDSGPGLPAELIASLRRQDGFPPGGLPAVASAPSRRRGRMGLGLYLAWGIVRAHGGALHAENMPDGGARFEVYLPAPAADTVTPLAQHALTGR